MKLRTLATILGVLVVGHVMSIAVLMTVRVLEPIRTTHQAVLPVARVHGILQGRTKALKASMSEVSSVVETGADPSTADYERLWRDLQISEAARPSLSYAMVPGHLRSAVVETVEANGNVANRLLETLLLVRLDRPGDARARLQEAEELYHGTLELLGVISQQGLDEVVRREQTMVEVATRGIRAAAAWALAGIIGVAILLVLGRRRVVAPLRELDEALGRVAQGDLDVEIVPRFNDELGRLAGQFNQMIEVVRAESQRHGRMATAGQLLADVAHEVKNPLMAISALATSRLDLSTDDGVARRDWRDVRDQANRAGKIVRDLLKFVQGDERIRARPCKLSDVCRDAEALVAYRFEVDEIVFRADFPEEPVWVMADPNRLEQVLVNLFSNALTALNQVEPPRILTVSCRLEADRAVFSVIDSGPGVCPEMADRLFHPFATSREDRGTGLGLYISRKIMREMGGGLDYVRTSGKGARFDAWLPLAEAPEDAPEATSRDQDATQTVDPPSADRPPRLDGITVLLVDDEEVVRRSIARFLTHLGARIVEAGDGQEALNLIPDVEPDLILSDLRMPRMSGSELYEALEGEAGLRGLRERFLILSGDISSVDSGRSSLSEDQIIIKPVELDALAMRIRAFVGPGSRS